MIYKRIIIDDEIDAIYREITKQITRPPTLVRGAAHGPLPLPLLRISAEIHYAGATPPDTLDPILDGHANIEKAGRASTLSGS